MSALEKQDDVKMITTMLFEKYKKIALNTDETAEAIGTTKRQLVQDRQEGVGIPYTRVNNKEKGKPIYSIIAIAKTIIENQVKVF